MWPIYLVICVVFAYGVYNRYLHPLSNVPGPFWASVTPLWLAWQTWQRRRPRLDLGLHRKYGSVVRIKPNEVIFSNPEYFNQVYGAGTKFVKARFYEAPTDKTIKGGYEKLDMLTEEDIDKLRLQRRFVGPIYSTKNALRHEDLMDEIVTQWVERLQQYIDQPLDFYHEVELFNVDLMTNLSFAHPFGSLKAGSDQGHMHEFNKMWRWWAWMGCLPWLNEIDKAYAPWAQVFNAKGLGVSLPVFPFAIGQIIAFDSIPKDEARRPCLLEDIRNLTEKEPRFLQSWGTSVAMTNEGAGVDTMSWTITSTLVGIAENPRVYAKVRAELAQAIQEGSIVKGVRPTYEAAAKLNYLQCCIHEAMRVWPNLAMSLPRTVPQTGMEIDGYRIPGGMDVGMNSRQLGLDTDIFGPDTEQFKPERWQEASKSQRNDMESRNLAFGGPSRKCIGMHLAWVALTKVLTGLLMEFGVEILNELDGKPGPGGKIWREYGAFPTSWDGLEIMLKSAEW